VSRVVLATPAPEIGGVTRHMLDLGNGLREVGHDVVFSFLEGATAPRRAAQAAGFPVVSLLQGVRMRSDVWHLHLHNSLDMRGLPLMAMARALPRRRVVLTEHLPRTCRTDPDLDWPTFVVPGRPRPGAELAKRAMKRMQFRVSRTVFVSRASRDFAAQRYRWPAKRLSVIFNGVRVGPDPGPPSQGELRCVAVGALTWQKGYDILLQALAHTRRSSTLTIVGDGGIRTELEEQARELGLSERVFFTGWREDPAAPMRDAHVLVMASRYESCPYVAIEAMANGRPVLSTSVDGLTDLVVDGETGVLVTTQDPHALADALDRLAEDVPRLDAMGRAAHARARARYSLETMLASTLEVYGTPAR